MLDVAEYVNQDATQRLMLTKEGTQLLPWRCRHGAHGSDVHLLGVQWHAIEAHSEGLWWALGRTSAHRVLTVPVQQPDPRPVLGWITWNGDEATPVLRNVRCLRSGMFHSFASSGTDLIVGGTVESLIYHRTKKCKPWTPPRRWS